MGVDGAKESIGPIRRFPTGFWAVFNVWWHGEYARLGQRPSSKAIGKWHTENAVKVWGPHAVSYSETQRHANRMKCRRTGPHGQQRHASVDEDDDEDDSCEHASPMDTDQAWGSGGPGASAGGGCPPADDSRPHASPPEDRPLGPAPRVNLGEHSDPPGALRGWMNADSDVPAPAAPRSEHIVRGAGGTNPRWMQPDPTMAPGPSQAAQGSELAASCLSWDSFSTVGRRSDAAACRSWGSGLSRDMGHPPPREGAAVGPASEQQPGGPHQASLPPRSNPFAELAAAAAAAAAAGRPAARAVPAARDAAALLHSAASVTSCDARSFQRRDTWAEAAWLRRAGAELDALMRDLGLCAGDGAGGNAAARPGFVGRPRVLCLAEPLSLPERGPRRDLDGLLRRRLQVGGSDAGLGPRRALLCGLGPTAVGGSGGSGGGAGGGLPGFMAIDSLPLELLL
ncbi:hypothetical protein PLESTF_000802200 [Pleodorina starrii]|nr:hypothetical protein PLESTM_001160900 [Pleodorina starrii]GLC69209.1 hypothetical protein PLESTF_000802200 [Pleodorina starrii]